MLVIGVYMMHKLTSPDDPMVFFYGDGAGAAILGRSDEPGFVSAAFAADGSYHKNWLIPAGGTAEPTNESSFKDRRTAVKIPPLALRGHGCTAPPDPR